MNIIGKSVFASGNLFFEAQLSNFVQEFIIYNGMILTMTSVEILGVNSKLLLNLRHTIMSEFGCIQFESFFVSGASEGFLIRYRSINKSQSLSNICLLLALFDDIRHFSLSTFYDYHINHFLSYHILLFIKLFSLKCSWLQWPG